ncbi:hypothetical protein B484DRAFT_401951 [Ochromonadaceae sp. CCMP2298]|nr:hypothetical protein B484DRAFT_401951 [Ochromonadaceae sp. CCMP2298]
MSSPKASVDRSPLVDMATVYEERLIPGAIPGAYRGTGPNYNYQGGATGAVCSAARTARRPMHCKSRLNTD